MPVGTVLSILRHPLSGLSIPLPALSSLLRAAAGDGGARRLESRCAVCLDDIIITRATDEEDKFSALAECGHVFHSECVDKWLRCQRTCPLCRVPVARLRRSCRERLLAAALSSFCRWMDSKFDSDLTKLFCQNL